MTARRPTSRLASLDLFTIAMEDNNGISSAALSPAEVSRCSEFERIFDEVHIPKNQMNEIVMDYLITSGYPGAADKFAAEADVNPKSDKDTLALRVDIRKDILAGKIQPAIHKIHDVDPVILDENPDLMFSLFQAQLIELIRSFLGTSDDPSGRMTAALEYASSKLAPMAPTNPRFLAQLEDTMCLLIFPPENFSDSLKALLDPCRRPQVADEVNDMLLQYRGIGGHSKLSALLKTRVWAENKAKEKDLNIPPRLDVALVDTTYIEDDHMSTDVPTALDECTPMDMEI